ncbi:isochorismatase family protein [Bailinhaonella thermotolerans]|uniref:Isochorismatase family protein n=1 Tax=Bailinhaonella thermotolerans TaxID=1070861 RepID=A0A3A4A3C2_9ACTN|nr:isochorismatase family protein [Bailinhaonella thermotolerans]RJL22074.1 isochorismatase family protein [Bailinhaonella thermotolerans]
MESALLVIDMQNVFLETAHDREGLLGRIAGLAARARAAGAPVVYLRQDGAGSGAVPGTPGWRIHDAVAPEPGDVVIGKIGADGFRGGDLDARLRGLGVRTLVVTGYATEFCVDSTARAALTHGYDVVLVSDGHGTFERPPGVAAITPEQSIAHHNQVLSVLIQPPGRLTLTPAAEVRFA